MNSLGDVNIGADVDSGREAVNLDSLSNMERVEF
jgi:hypothetical protein